MSVRADDVLTLARQLWSEQGKIALDQVDGTFYVHICLIDDIRQILSEAADTRFHPQRGHHRLRALIPNVMDSVWSASPSIVPRRPYLRDPVELSDIRFGGRLTAEGRMIERDDDSEAGLSWIRLGIRNRDWTGRDVEAAFRAHPAVTGTGIVTMPRPPYPENEAVAFMGATLYRAGEYGSRSYWNPDQEYPDSPPERWDENGQLRFLVDYSDPHWEVNTWGPMIVIAAPEPLPSEGVIAAFYDATVINDRRWHEALFGGSNGQDVPTAIRTWATALLMKAGKTFGQAVGALHYGASGIGGEAVSQKRFGEDRRRLLARAPEAKPFLTFRTPSGQ